MSEEHSTRKGRGVKWKLVTKTCMGESTVEGFTIDDLDKKTTSEAENSYEKVFVLIREALEKNNSCCMDVETERLHCTQQIADSLRKSRMIRS